MSDKLPACRRFRQSLIGEASTSWQLVGPSRPRFSFFQGVAQRQVQLLGKSLGAQASLPACFSQSAIAGSPQARMPALQGDFHRFRASQRDMLNSSENVRQAASLSSLPAFAYWGSLDKL